MQKSKMENLGSDIDDQQSLSITSDKDSVMVDFKTSENIKTTSRKGSSIAFFQGTQNENFIRIKDILLSPKESQYLAAVLQDSICEILILNNCNRELLESMTKKANDKKWSPRGNEAPPEDRIEKVDLIDLASDMHKLAKMESDRKYINDTLITIYLDLKNNGSFFTLLNQLNDLAAKTYQEIARELLYNECQMKLKELQAKLRKDTIKHKHILQECEEEIYHLLDEIDDSTWNSEIKMRYIERWQNAKIEQHTLAIGETEGTLQRSLSGLELKIHQENRINAEIENFIKYSSQDYSDQIEHWMKKFDEELEQLEMDLRVMKEKREEQLEATAALEKLMEDHRQELTAWIEFKEERARKKALEELRLRSAIRIQAWWRGVLARKLFAKMKKKK